MQIKVQPRIQRETWSLYWKASSKTDTECLEAVTLDVDDPGSSTVAALMDKVSPLQAHKRSRVAAHTKLLHAQTIWRVMCLFVCKATA
jgi:hypothetical protein